MDARDERGREETEAAEFRLVIPWMPKFTCRFLPPTLVDSWLKSGPPKPVCSPFSELLPVGELGGGARAGAVKKNPCLSPLPKLLK